MAIMRRKRVLRIRTGHLANFSAGAGYMPFVTMYSVPASIFCWIASFVLLRRAARKIRRHESPDDIRAYRADVAGFLVHTGRHLLVFAAITVLAALFLYPFAVSNIYDMEPGMKTGAFFLAVGPFLALIASTLTLMALTWRTGVRRRNLAFAGLAYTLTLIITILPQGGYLYLLMVIQWVFLEFVSTLFGVSQ